MRGVLIEARGGNVYKFVIVCSAQLAGVVATAASRPLSPSSLLPGVGAKESICVELMVTLRRVGAGASINTALRPPPQGPAGLPTGGVSITGNADTPSQSHTARCDATLDKLAKRRDPHTAASISSPASGTVVAAVHRAGAATGGVAFSGPRSLIRAKWPNS